MKKISISFLCAIVCCITAFGQVTPSAFTGCPSVYVLGFKNGTNCDDNGYNIYTINLTGGITGLLFSTPAKQEINGIAISNVDNKGYALQYATDACSYTSVQLIRFGANGATQMLGTIPAPVSSNSVNMVNTAFGAISASGDYYFIGQTGSSFQLGKIANVANLNPGSPINAIYTPITYNCPVTIADFAFNPANGKLYSYGISLTAPATGTLVELDLATSTVNCVGTPNTTEFTSVNSNMGGILFGADGFMYGVDVLTRKFYRINATTGAITNVGSVAGGTGQLRGDMGSCAVTSSTPPPTSFSCPNAYVVSFKNGTNCTSATHSVYTFSNYKTGALNPTPLFTTLDSIEVNALGISKLDGKGYGFMYKRIPISSPVPGASNCSNDTIFFFRFGANGVTETLGYVIRPAGTPSLDLSTAIGAMDAAGNYYFVAGANYQLYVCKISKTDTLTAIPQRSIPFTANAVNATCIRTISDWAISPTTGQLVSYGIYTNSSGQVAGTMVTLDLATRTLNCYGAENTTEFTDAGQDNFGGVMYGDDAYLYGVNVYTRKYYKISPATGLITYIGLLPYGSGPVRTDMASCISDMTVLPLGFGKPTATALGECKAAISWDISGAETGDAFVVEKSYDGRNYTALTTLKAVYGQSAYTFTDEKTGITNYYRIKGVSKNGEITYSSIVRFLSSCGNKNNVTLFQNLISGSNQVAGEVSLYKSQTLTATIYNATGTKVFSKTSTVSAGVSRFSYNVPTLSKGVYMLQTVIGEERFMEKFVVQ